MRRNHSLGFFGDTASLTLSLLRFRKNGIRYFYELIPNESFTRFYCCSGNLLVGFKTCTEAAKQYQMLRLYGQIKNKEPHYVEPAMATLLN